MSFSRVTQKFKSKSFFSRGCHVTQQESLLAGGEARRLVSAGTNHHRPVLQQFKNKMNWELNWSE
jgi:hypothetical protein